MEILGIDVGASGTKGAIVDITTGELLTDRKKLLTPNSGDPDDMRKVLAELVSLFPPQQAIGIGFPAAIQHNICKTATNIANSWIGRNLSEYFETVLQVPVFCLNDADAAGLAEMTFGGGQKARGLTILLTFGSGIGSAFFYNGELVPNTELGHLEMHGDLAERYASARTRKEEDLSWEVWGGRANEYLTHLEKLFYPDLFIIGGGLSRKFHKYEHKFTVETKVIPAENENNAGCIGSALFAARQLSSK